MKNLFVTALLFAAAPAAAQELADITPAMAADTEIAIPAARPYPGQDLSRAKALPDFSLDACEAALPGALKFRSVTTRGADGEVLHGFDRAFYRETGPLPVSLVLQTAKDAFFYYESCDIGADLVRCDVRTGKITPVLSAHSIGCDDLKPFTRGPNYYNACSLR